MFSAVSATALLMGQLTGEHRWGSWGGTYDEVLPYLREAFNHVLEMFSSQVANVKAPDGADKFGARAVRS